MSVPHRRAGEPAGPACSRRTRDDRTARPSRRSTSSSVTSLRMPFRFGVVTLTHAPQAFVRAAHRGSPTAVGRGHGGRAAGAEVVRQEPRAQQRRQLRPVARCARHRPRPLPRRRGRHRLRPFRAPLRRQIDAAPRAGPGSAGRQLRTGPDRPRRARRAVPRARSCRSTTSIRATWSASRRATSAPIWPASTSTGLPRQPAAGGDDRCPPHGRPGRPDHAPPTRPSASATACPRRSRKWSRLRPPLVQAQGRRRRRRRHRAAGAASPRVLDRIVGGYRARSTATSSTTTVDGVVALWRRCSAEPALAAPRAPAWRSSSSRSSGRRALARDVRRCRASSPVIIDESDDTLDAFVRARDLGYRGVSSKTCKGLYKSLINRALRAGTATSGTRDGRRA